MTENAPTENAVYQVMARNDNGTTGFIIGSLTEAEALAVVNNLTDLLCDEAWIELENLPPACPELIEPAEPEPLVAKRNTPWEFAKKVLGNTSWSTRLYAAWLVVTMAAYTVKAIGSSNPWDAVTIVVLLGLLLGSIFAIEALDYISDLYEETAESWERTAKTWQKSAHDWRRIALTWEAAYARQRDGGQ